MHSQPENEKRDQVDNCVAHYQDLNIAVPLVMNCKNHPKKRSKNNFLVAVVPEMDEPERQGRDNYRHVFVVVDELQPWHKISPENKFLGGTRSYGAKNKQRQAFIKDRYHVNHYLPVIAQANQSRRF